MSHKVRKERVGEDEWLRQRCSTDQFLTTYSDSKSHGGDQRQAEAR